MIKHDKQADREAPVNQLPALRPSDVPAVFEQRMHMARVFADSDLLPGHLRNKPANVLIILEGARALDVSAFWALQSMYVVDGKLTMSAELMRGLVLRAGHKFRVLERTDKKAVVELTRSDDDRPYVAEFTMAEAVAAGLTGKGNWKKYPKAMLVARATSTAVRDHCPDVLFGVVYTPDELGATTDQMGAPVIDENGRREGMPELTDGEIDELYVKINEGERGMLPAAWAIVTTNQAQYRTPTGVDDSLRDVMIARIARMVAETKTKIEVRNIWQLVRVLDLLGADVPVKVDEVDGQPVTETRKLAEVLESVAAAKPDNLPDAEAEATASEVVEPDEIIDAPKPEIDTENARSMREAATASWEDVRTQLTDLEAEQRARPSAPRDGEEHPDDLR